MLKIKEFVTENNFTVVNKKTSVVDAIKLAKKKKNTCVLVMDGDKLEGIFTDNDLAFRVISEGKGVNEPISNFMTKDPITIDQNTDVDTCMFLMIKNKFRHIPVRNSDGKVFAVATVMDILKAKVQEITSSEEARNFYESEGFVDRGEDTIESLTKEYGKN